jgi:hypothetical protein
MRDECCARQIQRYFGPGFTAVVSQVCGRPPRIDESDIAYGELKCLIVVLQRRPAGDLKEYEVMISTVEANVTVRTLCPRRIASNVQRLESPNIAWTSPTGE